MANKSKDDYSMPCGCIIYETIIGLIALIIAGICNGGFSLESSFLIQFTKWKGYLLLTPIVLLSLGVILTLLWEKFIKKNKNNANNNT